MTEREKKRLVNLLTAIIAIAERERSEYSDSIRELALICLNIIETENNDVKK